MMGNWRDVRSASGRLMCRIDAERRLLEIVRNGEAELVDLDEVLDLGQDELVLREMDEWGRSDGPLPGPGEVK